MIRHKYAKRYRFALLVSFSYRTFSCFFFLFFHCNYSQIAYEITNRTKAQSISKLKLPLQCNGLVVYAFRFTYKNGSSGLAQTKYPYKCNWTHWSERGKNSQHPIAAFPHCLLCQKRVKYCIFIQICCVVPWAFV